MGTKDFQCHIPGNKFTIHETNTPLTSKHISISFTQTNEKEKGGRVND